MSDTKKLIYNYMPTKGEECFAIGGLKPPLYIAPLDH